jgi:aspartyl protease family protein
VNKRLISSGFVSLSVTVKVAVCLAGHQVMVFDELDQMATTDGFVIDGSAHLGDAQAWIDGGDIYSRVRILLDGFDHIILQDGNGKISRVIILGQKGAGGEFQHENLDGRGAEDVPHEGPVQIILETSRIGNQHSVEISIETRKKTRLNQSLIVDTGATLVVLPKSLRNELGLDGSKLEQREIQTANGKVNALIGVLPGVWLADHRLDDVEVAFIEDEKLGGPGLLGMSVLGRYQMTIDDSAHRLILTSKSD